MIPRNLSELEKIREECQWMVTKRAVVSGVANLVPVPGADIAVDVGLLMELLPAINRKFGLDPEQIDGLDPQVQMMIYNLIVRLGTQMAGQAEVLNPAIKLHTLRDKGAREEIEAPMHNRAAATQFQLQIAKLIQ
jgi:hypothetical protein